MMQNRDDDEQVRLREQASFEDDGDISRTGFTERELQQARGDPDKTVTSRPQALSYISIACIIVNRMVGTGIFLTPTTVARGTHSTGCALVFWAVGSIVAMSGVLVFTEFGLTVPRMEIAGEEGKGTQSVPRNGGEKNYLEYFCTRPQFLATCIYGIPFIFLGNMVGNAIIFAENIVVAITGQEGSSWCVRGIAIGVASFVCLLHAMWRKGGIYLNNLFGLIKFAMLIVLFVLGVAYAAGRLGGDDTVARQNLSVHKSFSDAVPGPYGYAEAFLAILFAFGGFNQANYVLGEIDNPRKKFKPTAMATVGCVSVLYILINLSYMLVVPLEPFNGQDPAGNDIVDQPFFMQIFHAGVAPQLRSSLLAFSSFGNIIVQTFTAARVKQEIAKEGILPFSKFFARNYSLWPRWLRSKHSNDTSEKTPVGALLLHWFFAMVLILASRPALPHSAYLTFVNLYSFTIDAIFGFLVGLSLLILRLNPKSKWNKMSDSNAIISVSAAIIFTVANFFPLVAIWIPPSGQSQITQPTKWPLTGTIGMGLIVLALLYWLVIRYGITLVFGLSLEVEEREPCFRKEHGYWVLWHEIVDFKWRILD